MAYSDSTRNSFFSPGNSIVISSKNSPEFFDRSYENISYIQHALGASFAREVNKFGFKVVFLNFQTRDQVDACFDEFGLPMLSSPKYKVHACFANWRADIKSLMPYRKALECVRDLKIIERMQLYTDIVIRSGDEVMVRFSKMEDLKRAIIIATMYQFVISPRGQFHVNVSEEWNQHNFTRGKLFAQKIISGRELHLGHPRVSINSDDHHILRAGSSSIREKISAIQQQVAGLEQVMLEGPCEDSKMNDVIWGALSVIAVEMQTAGDKAEKLGKLIDKL